MFSRLLMACALASALPSLVAAQGAGRPPSRTDTGSRQVCDMRYKLLFVTVVNGRGEPVPGVTVTLTGIAATSEGRSPVVTSATGEAQLVEDNDMQFLPAGGAEVTITLRKGSKVRRVPMKLGRDEAGCHIALLSGSTTLTF